MASHTNGTGTLSGIAGTFTYTPPGGTGAAINGIVKSFNPKGSFAKRTEIMSQDAGILIGTRVNDRRIEGTLAGCYLSAGTTYYLQRGGIVVVSGLPNTAHNQTYEVMEDSHNYASGEDIEFTAELRYCEGFTATASAT